MPLVTGILFSSPYLKYSCHRLFARGSLESSGSHLRISLSENSGGEEIDQPLDGRIRLMIRPLDLCRLGGSILGPVMKQRVRQWAADSFVKQNEHRADPYPLLGEAVRIRTTD